jgi:hypothetical protein
MNKIITISFVALLFLVLSNCNSGAEKNYDISTIPDQKISKDSLISKGEYLVGILGCNDCHTPKKMGPNGPELVVEQLLSGYPADRPVPKVNKEALSEGWALMNSDLTCAVGPWGISFAANLTSDESGIGNWTYDQFKVCLTKGKHKGLESGRPLLPPMPWFNYVKMDDQDLKAVFTYLQSLPPVKNIVPAPITPDKL